MDSSEIVELRKEIAEKNSAIQMMKTKTKEFITKLQSEKQVIIDELNAKNAQLSSQLQDMVNKTQTKVHVVYYGIIFLRIT